MSTTPWNQGNRPLLARQRSSSNFIVATVSVAVFTDIFLYAAIVPTLPLALVDRFGVPKDDVQYWVSVSLAVFAAAILFSSPLWGYLADRIQNRQFPMLFGLVFLLATSLILCFGMNIYMLLMGRILQGMSAAMVWSVGLALVIDSVGNQHVGQAMGWIGSATSLGTLIAPVLGGLVFVQAGYYPVFAICFGLVALDVVLRLCVIEPNDTKGWLEAERDEQDSLINGTDSIHTVGTYNDELGTGLSAEINATDLPESLSPMSLVGLLKKPRLIAALLGTVIECSIQTCFDSTLPLYVSSVFGWGATGAGLIFLPLILPTLSGPIAGALSDQYGPKWLATIGFLAAAPLLACLQFVAENTIGHQVLLCTLLAGIGLSTTFIFGPLMGEITWSVEEGNEESTAVPYALAYGLHTMSFATGGILGPVLGSLICDNLGWPALGSTLGIVSLVAAAVQAVWTGGPLRLNTTHAV